MSLAEATTAAPTAPTEVQFREMQEVYYCPACTGGIPRECVRHEYPPAQAKQLRLTTIACPHCGQGHAADFVLRGGQYVQATTPRPLNSTAEGRSETQRLLDRHAEPATASRRNWRHT
jgi:predicted RNA-binding Zn-ribbon protein involved in translation (DUF1610 family)